MIIRHKNETLVRDLFYEHIGFVDEALSRAADTFRYYLAENHKEARDSSYRTHTAEAEADKIRRKIITQLYRGGYMAAVRKDLINYLSIQDTIADRAESACDFLITQQPLIPEGYCGGIVKILEKSADTLEPLKEALTCFFTDFSRIREPVKKVNTIEEEIDMVLREMAPRIFSEEKLDLSQKLHFHGLLSHLSSISDVIEEAADTLDSFVIKKKI